MLRPPGDSDTTRVTSDPSSMARPFTPVIRSPSRKPAAAAGELGCTWMTRAGVMLTPTTLNSTVKMAIARMKFAAGPAATTSARCHTGLK